MEFKDALKHAKQAEVFFWYADKGPDNKPLLLTDKKPIPPAEIAKTLKTCKTKAACKGTMAVDGTGTLNLTPRGDPLPTLAKGVQIVARENNAMPKAIVVLPSAPDDQAKAAGGDAAAAPPPPAGATPLITKPLPQKYAGEDKTLGWRAENYDLDTLQDIAARMSARETQKAGHEVTISVEQARERMAKSTKLVTRYFDDQERADAAVSFDPTGGAYVKDGKTPLQEGTSGQVVSPAGTMHTFDNGVVVKGGQTQVPHHSTPLAGGAVAGAGHVHVSDGHIVQVDDQSGHYKPSADMTAQSVKVLNEQGGLMDRRLVDHDGKALSPADYGKISPQLGKVAEKLAALSATIGNLPGGDASRDALVAEYRKGMAVLDSAADKAVQAMTPAARAALGLQGVGAKNKEANINLLDKRSGLTDEQYASVAAMDDDDQVSALKKMSRLNQLRAPLGDAAYTKMAQGFAGVRVLEAALQAGGDKLAAAMQKAKVETPEALASKIEALKEKLGGSSIAEICQKLADQTQGAGGKPLSIDQLRAQLGEQAIKAIENDEAAQQKLAKEYGVAEADITEVENQTTADFKIGQKGALGLSASQFMQTEGNEGQARQKVRLSEEIKAADGTPKKPAGPSVSGTSYAASLGLDDVSFGMDETLREGEDGGQPAA